MCSTGSRTVTSNSSSILQAGKFRVSTKWSFAMPHSRQKIPIMTTVRAALASANGIRSLQKRKCQCAACRNTTLREVKLLKR